MKWKKITEIDPRDLNGKRLAIFRSKNKKFTIAKIQWIKAHPEDIQFG